MEHNYHVTRFADRRQTELVVEVLNHRFPNVEFTSVPEQHCTAIVAQGKYSDFIHPSTMQLFVSEAVHALDIISIVIEKLEKQS